MKLFELDNNFERDKKRATYLLQFADSKPEYLIKNKHLFLLTPNLAYRFASEVLKGRFDEGEPIILQDPHATVAYARNVIGAPWKGAEKIIGTDNEAAYNYWVEFGIDTTGYTERDAALRD